MAKETVREVPKYIERLKKPADRIQAIDKLTKDAAAKLSVNLKEAYSGMSFDWSPDVTTATEGKIKQHIFGGLSDQTVARIDEKYFYVKAGGAIRKQFLEQLEDDIKRAKATGRSEMPVLISWHQFVIASGNLREAARQLLDVMHYYRFREGYDDATRRVEISQELAKVMRLKNKEFNQLYQTIKDFALPHLPQFWK